VKRFALSWVVAGIALGLGCGPGDDRTDQASAATEAPNIEGRSLLGSELIAPPLDPQLEADRKTKLAEARAAYEANPEDLSAVIWLGRRTAYLGRYRDAIAIYTTGLQRHPDNHKLLRHRGHRYISVRELDQAVSDLERASRLAAAVPDEVEPDGLPNARNEPRSSSHSNIWYHLGLVYYLKGEYEQAARCYRECLRFSTNPDMLCATSHWLYMTLRRLDDAAAAAAVLEPITEELDVIENQAYHRLLLMYRGRVTPETLLEVGEVEDALGLATVGYGVGNWYAYNGQPDRAKEVFRRVLQTDQWAAFGYIAAEADLARGLPVDP
jgi:tetratricopeptide (TPR) repeat protein